MKRMHVATLWVRLVKQAEASEPAVLMNHLSYSVSTTLRKGQGESGTEAVCRCSGVQGGLDRSSAHVVYVPRCVWCEACVQAEVWKNWILLAVLDRRRDQ
jgi:hypothetical protein